MYEVQQGVDSGFAWQPSKVSWGKQVVAQHEVYRDVGDNPRYDLAHGIVQCNGPVHLWHCVIRPPYLVQYNCFPGSPSLWEVGQPDDSLCALLDQGSEDVSTFLEQGVGDAIRARC